MRKRFGLKSYINIIRTRELWVKTKIKNQIVICFKKCNWLAISYMWTCGYIWLYISVVVASFFGGGWGATAITMM